MAIQEPASRAVDGASGAPAQHEYGGTFYRWAKLLSDRFWLAYLLVGLALMVVGAVGEVPKVGSISNNVYFPPAFLALGIALVVWSVLLVWLSVKPLSRGGATRSAAINPNEYGLTFNARTPSVATPPLSIKGSLQKALPEKWELWLVNYSEHSREYWPHNMVSYTSVSRKGWEITYRAVNYEDGDRRTLLMFMVGPDGQALISCFRKINEKLADPPAKRYEGFRELTSDMIRLGPPLQVTLKKPT